MVVVWVWVWVAVGVVVMVAVAVAVMVMVGVVVGVAVGVAVGVVVAVAVAVGVVVMVMVMVGVVVGVAVGVVVGVWVMVVSASRLRRCGHARVLDEAPRLPRRGGLDPEVAAALGDAFHLGAEYVDRFGVAPDVASEDVRSWLEVYASQRRWPPTAQHELAFGLNSHGQYVEVVETAPHVYEPRRSQVVPLATAGRSDVEWVEGDEARVVDLKSGVWLVEHPSTNLQLWAAGLAAAGRWFAEAARVGVYYPRRGEMVWSDRVERDTSEWNARLSDVMQAAFVGDRPTPSRDLCRACFHRRRCEHAWKERP